ncbi:hypothetical protein MMPV_007576 [Pyropia vietnamensis]
MPAFVVGAPRSGRASKGHTAVGPFGDARHRRGRRRRTHPPADEVVVAGPFDGAYGSWNLTAADVRGVQTYRWALLACAAATAAGVAGGLASVDPHALDAAAAVATASLGVAFWTIHVYLKPAHNLLKGLWVVGTVGGGVLGAATWAHGGLLAATASTPALLLGWGWLFVGATGLFFKEALCFGRPEAVGLAVGLPLLTGGHFMSGVAGGEAAGLGATLPDWEAPAAVAWAALFVFFAARKVWGQEVVADLGDKSVFAMLDERAAAAAKERGE